MCTHHTTNIKLPKVQQRCFDLFEIHISRKKKVIPQGPLSAKNGYIVEELLQADVSKYLILRLIFVN